jgi:hypothetical protein
MKTFEYFRIWGFGGASQASIETCWNDTWSGNTSPLENNVQYRRFGPPYRIAANAPFLRFLDFSPMRWPAFRSVFGLISDEIEKGESQLSALL